MKSKKKLNIFCSCKISIPQICYHEYPWNNIGIFIPDSIVFTPREIFIPDSIMFVFRENHMFGI